MSGGYSTLRDSGRDIQMDAKSAQTATVTPIKREMDRLHERLDSTHKRALALEMRLTPVMSALSALTSPDNNQAEGKLDAPDQGASYLTSELRDFQKILDDIDNCFRNMERKLEL